MKVDGMHVVQFLTLNYTHLYFNHFNHLKYAVIGVTSFGSNSTPETIPDASARITTEVKKWIKQIAKNAQDSGC